MQVSQPLLPSLGAPHQGCLTYPTLSYPTLPHSTHGRWFQDCISMEEKVASAPSDPLYIRPRTCKSRGGSVPHVLFASHSSVLVPLRTRVKCPAAGVLEQGEASGLQGGMCFLNLPFLSDDLLFQVCPGVQILLFIKVC